MAAINFIETTKSFTHNGVNKIALDTINLTIEDKKITAIVGPSGCGKTTCLRLVAGFETPSSGSVLVGGKHIHGPGPDRAVVFQQFALFPWKTVWENIDFGLKAQGISKNDRHAIIEKNLELINLKGYEHSFPAQLSGGMQQRVAIARAYALAPNVLLMDEPFGALDAQTRVVMQEELIKVTQKSPQTILFITHSVEEAIYLADQVVVMTGRPGRIKEIIDVESIRKSEKWLEHQTIEDIMDLESFVKLKTHVWKSLREAHH